MKKFTQIAFTAIALLAGTFAVKAQSVGIGTTTPNVSARLDISATNKGLLIPQVNLVSLTDIVTIPTPAKGLMVFNTNATLGTGFYYNNGSTTAAAWLKFQTGSASTSGWSLTGNTATDSATNFLGTTDAKPLMFRVRNGYAGMLSPYGTIALGRGAVGTQKTPSPGIIAIGDSALFSNVDDSSEIAIGNQALFSNNTAGDGDNVAIGNFSIISARAGFQNVAVGNQSLALTDSGFQSVAIGFGASFGSSAERNTAVGALALANDQVGFNNTAIGFGSMNSNVDGIYNTAVGSRALVNNAIGDFNTAVGAFSLANDSTGIRNVGIGLQAGNRIYTGSKNIAIGSDAMAGVVSGTGNICIGDSANIFSTTVPAPVLNNSIAIGQGTVVTASNTVRIGNLSTSSIGAIVGFTNLSDGRYKKDVEENVSGLDFIMKLRPVTYHFDFNKMNTELYGSNKSSNISGIGLLNQPGIGISSKGKSHSSSDSKRSLKLSNPGSKMFNAGEPMVNPNEGVRFTGFIAQEVEAAAKKAGYDFSGVDKPTNNQSNYGLRYAEFVVPLVKAVQEQQAVIDAQNKKIDELIQRLEKLENK